MIRVKDSCLVLRCFHFDHKACNSRVYKLLTLSTTEGFPHERKMNNYKVYGIWSWLVCLNTMGPETLLHFAAVRKIPFAGNFLILGLEFHSLCKTNWDTMLAIIVQNVMLQLRHARLEGLNVLDCFRIFCVLLLKVLTLTADTWYMLSLNLMKHWVIRHVQAALEEPKHHCATHTSDYSQLRQHWLGCTLRCHQASKGKILL